MSDNEGSTDIEVGASLADGNLRYWLAKEGLRQGESRLTAQAAIRTAMEARATAITGWASTSLALTAGVAFAGTGWAARAAAGITGAILLTAGGIGIYAARPRDWTITGYDPKILIDDTLGTELEVLESLDDGISPGIQANARRLDGMGSHLRRAGWALIAAPLIGGAAYVVLRAIT